MKIAYINPTVLLKRPIGELIQNLHKKHQITLFIPRKNFSKLDNSFHYSKLPRNVKIYSYPSLSIPFIASEWPIPISLTFFFQLFKVFKYNDIVHMWTYAYLSTFLALIVSKFTKSKLILTFDTVPGESFKTGKVMDAAFKIYHKIFSKFIFTTPKKLTVYGKSISKHALKLGAPKNKLNIIPTGTNLYAKPAKNIRKKYKIPKTTPIILFVGMLIDRKGVDIILRTINNIRDETFKLVIVGDGPNSNEYKKYVKQHKLQTKVIFTGFRKDVSDFYNSADIFFFPSKGEGMPGAIMEAMSFGIPIITSKIPGTIDLVNNKSAILVDLSNENQFTVKLKELLNNKTLRRKLSKKSKTQIKEFTWEKVISRYEQLYLNVLS